MSEQSRRAESFPRPNPSMRASAWWRQLDSRLWAGRADDRPAETSEHGHGSVSVDLDGARRPGCRTPEEAQDAATGPIRLPQAPPDERRTSQRVARLVLVLAAVVSVLALVWFALRFPLGG